MPPLRDRSGAALALTLVMLTVLLGVAALAVDIRMLYSAGGDAQKAADAGALAAASTFVDFGRSAAEDSVRVRAVRFATANRILQHPVAPERVEVEVARAEATARVRVRVHSSGAARPR